jgi:hypothetical protein
MKFLVIMTMLFSLTATAKHSNNKKAGKKYHHKYHKHHKKHHRHYTKKRRVGMATILLALSSSDQKRMPKEIAQKYVNKAVNFAMQRKKHRYWKKRRFKNRKALLVLGKDNRNEHPNEVPLLKELLEKRLKQGSVDVLIESNQGITRADLKGYDLIWYTVPGYPLKSTQSVKVLKEAFYDHYQAVVLSGDDVAYTQDSDITSFTKLKFVSNGTNACSEVTNNNKGVHSYIPAINGHPFRYGNDIDHAEVTDKKARVMSRAITDIIDCDVNIPVMIGHKIKVPNKHICK